MEKSRYALNKELAQMLKGGVIMDVTNYTDAKLIARLSEDLGEAMVGINSVSASARVLAVVDGNIVAARQENQLVTAFHPELCDDLRVHQYFLQMIKDNN